MILSKCVQEWSCDLQPLPAEGAELPHVPRNRHRHQEPLRGKSEFSQKNIYPLKTDSTPPPPPPCITADRAGGGRLGEATQIKTTLGGEGCPFSDDIYSLVFPDVKEDDFLFRAYF